MRRSHWLVAGLLLCCAGAVGAQTGSSERVLRSFRDCRTLPDGAARLACFDKAAASLEGAVEAKDVTIVDRQDIRQARRSLFGFTLPKTDLFGGKEPNPRKADDFVEINTTVASSRALANGRAEIRLADDTGAVWQTTDPMNFPPHPNARIRIRQGTLGSYFLNVDGRSYRGMRVR